MHIYEIQKYDNDALICKTAKEIQNGLLDYVGEGEGGQYETSIQTCILPYIKWMTGAGLMHEVGHSKLVLWDDPEGWGREGGGRVFRLVGHMCTHG